MRPSEVPTRATTVLIAGRHRHVPLLARRRDDPVRRRRRSRAPAARRRALRPPRRATRARSRAATLLTREIRATGPRAGRPRTVSAMELGLTTDASSRGCCRSRTRSGSSPSRRSGCSRTTTRSASPGYARDALPVLGGWFAAALVFGAYRNPSTRTLLLTWIVGVPLGILIRALALGRDPDGDQAVFLGISLAFTLLFVLAWRAGARVAVAPRVTPDRARPAASCSATAAAGERAREQPAGPSSRARRQPSRRSRRAARAASAGDARSGAFGAPKVAPRRDRDAAPRRTRAASAAGPSSVAKPHHTKTRRACTSRVRTGTPHWPPSPVRTIGRAD